MVIQKLLLENIVFKIAIVKIIKDFILNSFFFYIQIMLTKDFILKKKKSFLLSKNYSKNIQNLNKKQFIRFDNFYGIGKSSVSSVFNKYGLNSRIKVSKVKYPIFRKMKNMINKITLKNKFRNKQIEIRKFTTTRLKNYKGMRHLLRYTVRGQRTHSNGKTRKRLKDTKHKHLT